MFNEKVLQEFTNLFNLPKIEHKEPARDWDENGICSYYIEEVNYIPSGDACLSFIALLNRYGVKSTFEETEDTSIMTKIIINVIKVFKSLEESKQRDFKEEITDIVQDDLEYEYDIVEV